MSSDIVVAVVVVLLVAGSVAYMIHQRRNGKSSCGCSGCNACKGCKPGANVVNVEDNTCDCCKKD